VVACLGSLCVSAPALAAGRTDDASATRAYLHASEAYARNDYAELAVRVAAIEARASEIARECPSALTYAPRDEGFAQLTEVTSLTVVYAGVVPVNSVVRRLGHAIAHLSWSNTKLTRLARSQAVQERSIATLVLPDVCADIAAWRSSAYRVLPLSAAAFLTRLEPIEAGVGPSGESLEAVIARLLKPYQDPAERRVAEHIERLEERSDRQLTAAIIAARTKLAAALGVSAL
jgi:hypothetical protein